MKLTYLSLLALTVSILAIYGCGEEQPKNTPDYYEINEKLAHEPNSSGISQVHYTIALNPIYQDSLDDMVLKQLRRNQSSREYQIYFAFKENPPSLQQWIDKDELDKDVNTITALYRKGKESAYKIFHIPTSGEGFIE